MRLYGYIGQDDYEPAASAYERFDNPTLDLNVFRTDRETVSAKNLTPFNARVRRAGCLGSAGGG